MSRYPPCEISRRASSRPARASHAAAAAPAVGCGRATRGVDGPARGFRPHRSVAREHVGPGIDARRPEPLTDLPGQDVRLVFRVSKLPPTAGGGGGGGNQRPEPFRRAQGVGSDPITLRVQRRPSPPAPVTAPPATAAEDVPSIPSIVLDAKPLASGFFNQTGLPAGGVLSGPSTGPGSGGGVGTGRGTGIGPGRGPGLGPGSGGGTGGGVYRPGGSVSAPRLIRRSDPVHQRRDDSEGSRHGPAGSHRHRRRMRVADPCRPSLDAGGLDQEAWRPWPNGGSSLAVLGPRRSMCSSRSTSALDSLSAVPTGNAVCFGWVRTQSASITTLGAHMADAFFSHLQWTGQPRARRAIQRRSVAISACP